MKKRILHAINRAIAMGHATAHADFSDLELVSIPEAEMRDLFESFDKMLSEAGYEFEWDGPDHLWIQFESL